MSGIMGRAGSKSGIISQTELIYEEGTFSVQFAPTGGSGYTYTMASGQNEGRYCRVGNIVTFNLRAGMSAYTAGSASGELVLNSLPFATTTLPTSDGPTAGGGLGRVVNEPAHGPMAWYATNGSAVIRFAYRNTNSYWYVSAHSAISANMSIYFGGSYVCAS
jgi:hypothetical protein